MNRQTAHEMLKKGVYRCGAKREAGDTLFAKKFRPARL